MASGLSIGLLILKAIIDKLSLSCFASIVAVKCNNKQTIGVANGVYNKTLGIILKQSEQSEINLNLLINIP